MHSDSELGIQQGLEYLLVDCLQLYQLVLKRTGFQCLCETTVQNFQNPWHKQGGMPLLLCFSPLNISVHIVLKGKVTSSLPV